jgi:GMP synthase (glutamine-hydrolysing)
MLLIVENEVDLATRYFVPEIISHLPTEVVVHDAVAEGGRPSLRGANGVILAGSTSGVYEKDERPWISDEEQFVRRLCDRNIPTLGICFGHQLINEALGGRVEHQGLRAELVEADLTNDPLFKGVSSTLPALHGDVVVEAGEPMDTIASVDGYRHFATRHAEAPIWTTQYHPEFTSRLRERIAQDIGWHENHLSFEAVTATRTLVNFAQLVERYGQ